jgi:protoheme IX farnesyltransferase
MHGWKPVQASSTPRDLLQSYAALSKSRLAMLVVLTTMSGYAMAPFTCSTSATALLWTTIGTGLCVSAANSINQWLEVPFDAQMSRTRTRTLVRHRLTPLHAFGFGFGCGVTGVGLLASMVNPITAWLGRWFHLIFYKYFLYILVTFTHSRYTCYMQ